MYPLLRLGFFLLAAGLFLSYTTRTFAAATLKLSPSSQTVAKDSTFTVSASVSTGGEAVNFIAANISYPKDKLEAQGFDETNTIITIWPEKTYNNDLGRVDLSGALYNPGVNGNDLKIIGIRFKVLGNSGDTAVISFRDTSEVYRISDTTDILGTKINGTYSIGGPGTTNAPEPTQISSTTVTPKATGSQNISPTGNLPSPTGSISPTAFLPTQIAVTGGQLPQTGHEELIVSIAFFGFLLFLTGIVLFKSNT